MVWSLPVADELTIGQPAGWGNRPLCLSQPAPDPGQPARFLDRHDGALGTAFEVVLDLGPQQVGLHHFRGFDHGQPPGVGHWLLKLDGVSGNKDKELEDPQGYGVIEFAYNQMAEAAGITMSECRLLEEKNRRHFMTRRFDRDAAGARLHMQSLGAMAHLDYNEPGSSSYEQAFLVKRQLRLPMQATEEQFRRMVFNLAARNQDDHVKNIAFLMDRQGQWSLSPAFDVTWSFNPQGDWTATHQMSVNGKRDQFNRADLEAVGRTAQLKRGRAETIAEQVITAVRAWPRFAAEAGVPEATWSEIQSSHRLTLLQP